MSMPWWHLLCTRMACLRNCKTLSSVGESRPPSFLFPQPPTTRTTVDTIIAGSRWILSKSPLSVLIGTPESTFLGFPPFCGKTLSQLLEISYSFILISNSRRTRTRVDTIIDGYRSILSKSKCISRKSGLMPCLKTILNFFALEHSTLKTKHLKMS